MMKVKDWLSDLEQDNKALHDAIVAQHEPLREQYPDEYSRMMEPETIGGTLEQQYALYDLFEGQIGRAPDRFEEQEHQANEILRQAMSDK